MNKADKKMTETNEASGLGVYLHVPYCVGKCGYCAFYSEPIAGGEPEGLIGAMGAELDLYDIAEPVRTVYIGGGSPSCLPREQKNTVLPDFWVSDSY